ncbi:transcriptional regulator, DeoR family [Thermobaculum terrenum ATCC BAA-798]|uniref:Transcriptional regulator, DeoR family n=1 Tax=Thermobaculum terrenum (strain ATCC BAA-798 / CCMEE 7001 / YNP1) TaxID=525904 RepID=D1CID0_THET1|nr:DeoR/GlpR family DNA-binding transcription regulator [Thermobaculum terrenum]ACZ43501.1 transcriptional regulator, DeoR family [Thermobaculum terrenum ATCC BAA-798]
MLDAERRQQIVSFIEENNGATVAELSRQFGVSEATIRRDLLLLSRKGLIERAHGGGVPRRMRHTQGFPEPPLLSRAALQVEEKRRIGRAAAQYVDDGDSIMVSGGTTTAEMIPYLADKRDLTVITSALNIATLLASYPNITVIVLGGVLRHGHLSLLGVLTEEALENIRADKLFMGTPAIHADYGLSADDMAEVQVDRALMDASREVIVLADHTKFGRVATIRVAPIRRIRRVITDKAAPQDDIAALREQGIKVDVV